MLKPLLLALTLGIGSCATVTTTGTEPWSPGTRPDPAPAENPAPPPESGRAPLADRLIAFFPCASDPWSADNPHHMSSSLEKPGGWARFADTRVAEAVERFGFRRVFFHLPFGKSTGQSPRAVHERRTGVVDESLDGWHMSLDHIHDLRRTGNLHIAEGFYSAMDRLHARHPHVEVIVYVGSWDTEDRRYLESHGEAALQERWAESIDPLIERDYISIVFDAAVGKDEDHPNARLVQRAHRAKQEQPGRFVGVEARIQKGRPWPNELCLTTVAWEDVWRRQGHAGNIAAEDLCARPIRVIDGRSRAILKGDAEDPLAWHAIAADIAREGHDPAVSIGRSSTRPLRQVLLRSGSTLTLPPGTGEGPFSMPAGMLAEIVEDRLRAEGKP